MLQDVTWCYTVFHGVKRSCRVLYGVTEFVRCFMVFHGVPGCYMVFHGVTRS